LGDPGVDGRITLRCIFRKWDVGVWNEPSGSLQCGGFLDWLRTGLFVKNLSAPWNK